MICTKCSHFNRRGRNDRLCRMGLIIGRETCECFLDPKHSAFITGDDGYGAETTKGWRCPKCGALTSGEECQECGWMGRREQ